MESKAMRAWLEQEGYFGKDKQHLLTGKAKWKQKYQREYQRQRRRERKQVVISLDRSDEADLRAAAIQHHRPLATYIRESSLAYSQQTFLLPDPAELVALREELAFIRYHIEDLVRLMKQSFGSEQEKQLELLIDRIDYLERFIVESLSHPPLVAKPS
ncbi:MAG: hypothetical protein AAFN10_21880 [Bacteroidota bacterium]